MAITIVIPYYNREGCLESTLRSILQQSYRPLRLILVDNNSTDGSRAVATRWAEAHRSADFEITLLEEKQPGAAAARQRGLQAVDTDWVMFFDSDDYMHPGLVSEIAAAIEANPSAQLVMWNIRTPVSAGRSKVTLLPQRNFLYNHLVHGVLSTQRYAVRTEFFRRVGGWNPAVRVWDDLETGCRILAANPSIVILKGGPYVTAVETRGSITDASRRSFTKAREEALDAIWLTLDDAFPGAAVWVDYRRLLLAAEYRQSGWHKEATRLVREVISRHNRLWYLLYYKHLIYQRGTHLFAPFSRRL